MVTSKQGLGFWNAHEVTLGEEESHVHVSFLNLAVYLVWVYYIGGPF